MEKSLPVPYKSQWDNDAGKTYNDCGPASLAMVLNFYGNPVTTDQVFKQTGAGKGLITYHQLFRAIETLGYTYKYERDVNIDRIKQLIDAGTPPIVLVHYEALTSRQDTSFKKGHFMVVVGYRADDSLYVNDPNFKDPFRQDGDHHVYKRDEFNKAWADCVLDGNKAFQLVYVEKSGMGGSQVVKSGTTVKALETFAQVTAAVGVRIRNKPSLTGKQTSSLKRGDRAIYSKVVEGDSVEGNNLWLELTGKEGYVWSGGTNYVTVKPEVQATQKEVPSNELAAKRIGELETALAKIRDIADTVLDVGEEEKKSLLDRLFGK